jgi:hypothetical protein
MQFAEEIFRDRWSSAVGAEEVSCRERENREIPRERERLWRIERSHEKEAENLVIGNSKILAFEVVCQIL